MHGAKKGSFLTEQLTEDLLNSILSAAKPEDYLAEGQIIDRDLPDYLFELLYERDLKRSDVISSSGLNQTVVYDIFSGKFYPGRDNAIMLAFGLGCSLLETQRLLRLAGVSELWPKVRRDAIIIWSIKEGLSRAECDDELWRLGEATLLAVRDYA